MGMSLRNEDSGSFRLTIHHGLGKPEAGGGNISAVASRVIPRYLSAGNVSLRMERVSIPQDLNIHGLTVLHTVANLCHPSVSDTGPLSAWNMSMEYDASQGTV